MRYQEFSLRLDPAPGGGFTVRVGDWKSGQASAPVDWRLGPDELRRLAASFERGPAGEPAESLKRIGGELWDAVFPPPIRERFFESRGRSGAEPLRIRLQMALDTPESIRLHALPWEALCRNDLGVFLEDAGAVVVRSPELPAAGERPPVAAPLRILAVGAQAAGRPALDLAGELAQLQKAGSFWNRVKVTPLRRADLGSLREALLGGGFHVLHFMGHGEVDEASGRGCLWLDDGAGGSARISGEDLAVHLRGIPSLRLVFLNACRTASGGEGAPFASTADALLRAEIPAVVAMQAPISDIAALDFSRTFYRRLARREPLEAAVAEGRLAIRRERTGSGEWATPVLFLRAADGQIVEPRSPLPGKTLVAAAALILALAYGGGRLSLRQPEPVAPVQVPAEAEKKPAPAGRQEAAPAPKPAPPESRPKPPRDSNATGALALLPSSLAPTRTVSRSETVREGEPLRIEAWKAEISISIQNRDDLLPGLAENPVLTVALAPEDGDVQRKPVLALPDTAKFTLAGKTRSVRVQAIDWKARTARLSWVESR